jgi:hypothetical protein
MTGRGYALRLAGALVFLGLAAWAAWSSYRYYDRRFYTGLLPKQLGVSDALMIDGRPLSGCGVAAFWLDQPTLDAVNREGIAFLEDATRARRSTPGDPDRYSWRQTPMPPEVFSEGWWYGFECAEALSHAWKVKIYDAARAPGSFYSHDPGHGDLLVVPSLRIVVLIYPH